MIQKELNSRDAMINTSVPGGENVHNFQAKKKI